VIGTTRILTGMEQASRPPGIVAAFGLATGLSAVLAASCCVLPLIIGGLGAGAGVFAVLEMLADYRTPLLIVSSILVVTAWFLYFRRRGTPSTAIVLVLAIVLVVTAANWALFEPSLLKIVRASR
jgi:mercuric ion transport protein